MRCIATLLSAALALGCDGPAATDAGTDAGADAGTDANVPDAGPRCAPAIGLPEPLACNGHAALCDRTFDGVAFPATHNAMSSEEEGWIPPNQGFRLWRQLEDGVRGFMLDTYEQDGETLLCHSICPLGSRPFVHALTDLREFMDCHPAEVITLILEAHIDEPRTAAAFEAAGLDPYLHAQPLGAPWPTLRELITSGRRMVVFTESADVSLPWHHYAYAYAWDNPYSARMPSDLSCRRGRGSTDNPVFILNHFLTAPVAMRALAEMINHEPFLGDQVRRCRTETGQLPNFVTVDFYDVGDLFAVVDELNGL
ncbi:MAG: hypothetical protein KF729_02290 [Sandaracinaceae bacterium]|nr:hypothetical protein [Sandaracinaceae bacterium]